MEFFAHSINTLSELNDLEKGFGIEIDLRDEKGNLVLGHDPLNTNYQDLTSFLKYVNGRSIIANIKSERIEPQPNDWVFKGRIKGRHLSRKSTHTVLKRTLEQLGIEEASSHSMRRSMLTKLKDIGYLESDIMEISGHSDLNSLKKYLKTSDKKKKEMIYALN